MWFFNIIIGSKFFSLKKRFVAWDKSKLKNKESRNDKTLHHRKEDFKAGKKVGPYECFLD